MPAGPVHVGPGLSSLIDDIGQASDVVGAAVFLASEASDFVHGHLLLVDGGYTAI
jgi:NAD(P)-dependent dehydrogenase (short-subunit alcohol dehydrogenase family)